MGEREKRTEDEADRSCERVSKSAIGPAGQCTPAANTKAGGNQLSP
jgi:hypothetical protein